MFFPFALHLFQDQAKKALESALGGKKTEFEKWDKEIKKREEAGGGGGGGGGWWRRWFAGSDGEHFWHEAQQVGLTLLAIVVVVNTLIFISLSFNGHFWRLNDSQPGFCFLTSNYHKTLPISKGWCLDAF